MSDFESPQPAPAVPDEFSFYGWLNPGNDTVVRDLNDVARVQMFPLHNVEVLVRTCAKAPAVPQPEAPTETSAPACPECGNAMTYDQGEEMTRSHPGDAAALHCTGCGHSELVVPRVRRALSAPSREWLMQKLAECDIEPMAGQSVAQVERKPDGYAYEYPGPFGGILFTSGGECNGSKPIRAIPYYLATPPSEVEERRELSDAVLDAVNALLEAHGDTVIDFSGWCQRLSLRVEDLKAALAASKEKAS